MRLVCISDTHTYHPQMDIPPGDILIHAGDFTHTGHIAQTTDFLTWFAAHPHPHKLLICGNHDFLFHKKPAFAKALIPPNVTYLEDQEIVIDDVRFYGSPWCPRAGNWAFMKDRDQEELKALRDKIPSEIDVLITHGPPKNILDMDAMNQSAGCTLLYQRIQEIKPRVHIFGHIHESYGQVEEHGIEYINASAWNYNTNTMNPAIVVDLLTGEHNVPSSNT